MDLYHVLNRGTDKRTIFMDDRDRLRFTRNLFEMNDSKHVYNTARTLDGLPNIRRRVERDPLVTVHGWCLMNNHYHLLLSEVQEKGISKFLQKINMGYSKYFNVRHHRVGTLFQGKTKKKLIDRESYFLWILHYIHFNPLDYLKETKTWRNKKVPDSIKALNWLMKYRWSSFHDYMGIKNFPDIVTTSYLNYEGQYTKEANRYLKALQDEPRTLTTPTYRLE